MKVLHNRHFIAIHCVYLSFNKQIKRVGCYKDTFSFMPNKTLTDNYTRDIKMVYVRGVRFQKMLQTNKFCIPIVCPRNSSNCV